VAANQGRSFFDPKTSFSTHFDPKHFRQLDKLIHGLKNHLKIQNQPEIKKKILLSSYMFFYVILR
jgi:hypothetical protein